MNKEKIMAQCSSCTGTGIFQGYQEIKTTTGVVCLDCNGEGKKEIEYTPFTGIKENPKIQIVTLSDRWIYHHYEGNRDEVEIIPVSYEEFKQGKKPEIKTQRH